MRAGDKCIETLRRGSIGAGNRHASKPAGSESCGLSEFAYQDRDGHLGLGIRTLEIRQPPMKWSITMSVASS